MADEFQAGVCGESSWWNYSTTQSIFGLSPNCGINYDPIGYLSDLLDMKANSITTADESCSDDSMVLHPDWNNQPLRDSSYLNSSQNYSQENGVKCPELKRNYSCITEDNSIKPVNQDFSLHQSVPMNSSSFAYSSELLQTLLFDTDPQQPQESLFVTSAANYAQNLNSFTPSVMPKSPSLAKQTTHLQSLSPRFEEKPSLPNIPSMSNIEEIRESTRSSFSKSSKNEAAYKRPRIETPSPLPSFKVRKEKMGDRITALQQLVSPFGKTDTASVLQEAIDYIKFLHDQVNVLSTPHMKNGSPAPRQQVKGQEGLNQDLTSRGLCIVPISSTYPAAVETSMDFWTPSLGGTFR